MASETVMAALHEALLSVKERPKNIGICNQILDRLPSSLSNREFTNAVDTLDALMRQWPKYSGDPEFPVPHPSKEASEAYLGCADKWSKRSAYGRARWELLDYLIERTKG